MNPPLIFQGVIYPVPKGSFERRLQQKMGPQPTGCYEIYPVLREFFVCNAMHCCMSPWKCLISPNQPRSTKKLLVFASESSKTKSSLKLGDTSSLWSRFCNENNMQSFKGKMVENKWLGGLPADTVCIYIYSIYIYKYHTVPTICTLCTYLYIYINIWLGLCKARWWKRNVQY